MANKTTTKTVKVSTKGYTAKGLKVTSLSVAMQQGSDRGVYAQWKFSIPKAAAWTEGFEYDWEYTTGARMAPTKAQKKAGKPGDLVWLPGSSGSAQFSSTLTSSGMHRITYTAPSSAIEVRCRILPLSNSRDKKVSVTKTYTNNKLKKTTTNKESFPYFTGSWSGYASHDFRSDALAAPSVEAELMDNGTTAVVTVSSDDADAGWCDVEVTDSGGKIAARAYDKPLSGEASFSFALAAGRSYTARARVQTTSNGSKKNSQWASAAAFATKPAAPTGPSAAATGPSSARVTWTAAAGAESYTVQHTTGTAEKFETDPESVDEVDGISATSYTPSGLDQNAVHWFRVRAVNGTGESAWSAACSCLVATKPEAPTVYGMQPSYIEADDAVVRWTHNSADGSAQSAAQVDVAYSGANAPSGLTVTVGAAERYTLSLAGAGDATAVAVRVRTKGAHADWSPWSGTVGFTVYEQPQLQVTLSQGSGTPLGASSPLGSFPVLASLAASGGGDSPVGYDVSIVCTSGADYIDEYGYTARMDAGGVAWEEHYATSDDPLAVAVAAGDAFLADGASYELRAAVAMESGLRAEASAPFSVSFDMELPAPIAEVTFDADSLTADVVPACFDVDGTTGVETSDLRPGTLLSVYRIGQDGILVPLARRVPNDGTRTVTDPHAAFGTCWYHVVATDEATGASSFSDWSADSSHPDTVIMWGGDWRPAGDGETRYEYDGTVLDGFCNSTFSQDGEAENEPARYSGRKRPVHYYGEGLVESMRYDLQFERADARTMALVRALMSFPGDVYVREPTGTGFWAHVRCTLSWGTGSAFATLSATATPSDVYDAAIED